MRPYFGFVNFCLLFLFLFSACTTEYRDYANANGRQIVIDQANNFLTVRECDQAISVLLPLYNSTHVDNEVRMVYASAYGCKGGIDFSKIISALADVSGADLWSPLIQANYSIGDADGKIPALYTAADILRQTAEVPGSYEAHFRETNVNIYMIFIQLNVITAILAPLGQANQTTGHKTVTGFAATSSETDRCRTTVAFANLVDSVRNTTAGGNFSKVEDAVDEICNDVFAGLCPTNKIYENCTVADRAAGQLILDYLDTGQWGF